MDRMVKNVVCAVECERVRRRNSIEERLQVNDGSTRMGFQVRVTMVVYPDGKM
jgi:hypothetical protein